MRYLFLPLIWLLACTSSETQPEISLQVQNSGTKASLRGLDVVDTNIVWASGANGTVLRTVDGGTTWEDVSIAAADTLDFRDIEAFSATEAVVLSAGFPGVSYRTADGGKTWEMVYFDDRQDIFFDAMDFWDDQAGIAFGDALAGRVVLITTNDGGRSWQRVAPEQSPPALDGEGGFAASGTCITTLGDSAVWIAMGAPASRVLYSANRGKTWWAVATPMAQEKPGAGIFSIAFSSPDYGLAIGGNYMAPDDTTKVLARSTDGGKTWKLIHKSGINGYKSAIAYIPGTEAWLAAGPTGVSYSHDNGESWVLADSTAFHTMVMANKTTGYLSGGKGIIARLKINQEGL